MSTGIEGIYFRGNLPVSGATVTAQSVDGYSEGSATTDSNGRFAITGLTDRDWLAKATSDPVDGTFYLLPNPVKHINITSVEADQHHVALVGLLDSSGKPINPGGDDRIQIADDGVINADFDQEQGGILTLSIDQIQIDHGEIGGTFGDDHPVYLAMVGRSGGQEVHGGVDSGDNLTLRSTTHETPGNVYIGGPTLFDFDESTGRLSLPSTSINGGLLIGGDVLLYRNGADELKTPDALTVGGQLQVSESITIANTTGYQLEVLGQGISNGIVLGGDAQWYRDGANVLRTPGGVIIDIDLTVTGDITVGGTVDGVDIAARDHDEDHAARHAENAADELLVEDLGTASSTDGQIAKADGSGGLAMEDDDYAIEFIIDGGGSAITTGEKGHAEVPASGVIEGWTILADQSGSIVVDVWLEQYADYPPTVADTIAGSEKPTLSGAVKNQDLALGTWTPTVTKGDIIAFKVDSAATVERVLVSLRVRKT